MLGRYHNFMILVESRFHKIIYKGSEFYLFFLNFYMKHGYQYFINILSLVSRC